MTDFMNKITRHMDKATDTSRYPLTSSQREIWFNQQLYPTLPLYNIGGYVNLPGRIDPRLFQQAVNLLIRKHDNLRIQLLTDTDEDSVPYQQRLDTLEVTVPVQDVTSASDPVTAAQDWMQEQFRTPFVLTGQPLFRYDLIKLADDHYYWLLQYHHLINDGWGIALLNRSLAGLYSDLVTGQSPNLSAPTYTDWITQDRAYIASTTFRKGRDYWLQQYPTAPEPLLSPCYRSQYTDDVIHSDSEIMPLPRAFYQQLEQLAAQHRVSLFPVLIGALFVYFTRITQREDFVIGLPVLNRASATFKQTAGLFTGVSAVWLHATQTHTFVELVQQIKRDLQGHYRHQRFPVSELNRAVSMKKGRHQLFDISLSYENHDYQMLFGSVPGQAISLLSGYQSTPLTLFVRDFHTQHPITCDFVYNRAYFNATDIQALQARFVYLLEQLLSQGQLPIRQLSILTSAEQQQLQAWNDTAVDYLEDQTLVDLFAAQVERTPDNLAIRFEGETLSYRQLNTKANQLAHHLHRQTDAMHQPLIQPDTLVGLCVERSLEMVIGLLGILKAGGAYVPLDPDYPAERLAYMLADSQVSILLTQQRLQDRLTGYTSSIVCLDDPAVFAHQPDHNLPRIAQPHHLAYVIYTSGSTGKPKGVMVTHHNVQSMYAAWQRDYPLTALSTHLQMANYAFDVFTGDWVRALGSGGLLVLCPRKILTDPGALYALMKEQMIRCAEFVPAVLRGLLDYVQQTQQKLDMLQLCIVGSDYWYPEDQQHLQACCVADTCLVQSYGVTEATIDSTYQILPWRQDDSIHTVPIGIPFPNVRIHILDPQHQLVPVGIPGELCIAGAGLARGYLNRPDLTAEKFVEVELFGQLERIYRTGDLARWLPDGNLEYLGRMDHQVKLRGFRIELSEIEAVLSEQAAISEAVVVVYDRVGNQSLAAYVTVAEETLDRSELRATLQSRLPDYMVPNSFTLLDQMPLTPNGKIDRKALPEPDLEVVDGTLRTETEQMLARLWSDVLHCEVTSHQAHFFALGGHSLLATQLVTRIRHTFDIEVSLATLFALPVLRDQAHGLTQQQRGNTLPVIRPQPAAAPKALSFAQQRLWFLAQLEQAAATYHMPAALRLQGPLNVSALRETFGLIVARHDSLRHYFVTQGEATLVNLLSPYDPLTVIDLQHLAEAAQQDAVQQRARVQAQQPFDLSTGPLFRLVLLRLAAEEAVLLLNMHHIISDGWSITILIQEWNHVYTALSQGEAPQLAPLPVQYTDYAAWQRDVLIGDVLTSQQAYWQAQLQGAPLLLELPTDYPRPAQQTYRGAHYSHTLCASLTAQLHQFSRTQHATLYMTLLAVFNVLLYRYTGQEDILVGSPIAGRTQRETEHLIGLFVNTLVLRTRFHAAEPHAFADLLHQVRQTTLAAYAHQDIPFEQLVDQLQPERSLSHSPLFQVMFVLQNNASAELSLPGLAISPITQHSQTTKFDLLLNAAEVENRLKLTWEYAIDLFAPERIERMAAHFEHLLTGMVNQPTRDIRTLPLLTEAELNQLQRWNDTAVDYPQDQSLVDLFEAQVERTPDKIAIRFEDKKLSYRQLNAKANQLAHHLRSQTHANHQPLVQPDALIGLCVERSLEMIIGLLGILKAGGAYVPLDPDYPAKRLAYLLADSQVPMLLTQQPLQNRLPGYTGITCCLDEPGVFAHQPDHNLPRLALPHHLAYVIYTSGSTGTPKGVCISQQALNNFIRDMQQRLVLPVQAQVMALTTLSFDIAGLELYLPLISGATIQLVSRAIASDGAALQACLSAPATRLVQATPATWQILQSSGWQASHPLTLLSGGEKLSPALSHYLLQQSEQLWNLYGPTETTIWSTAHNVTAQPAYPDQIGQPIANTRIHLLDAQHQLVPLGIPGELCIAGAGLARGYLNRPELTAEKFIEVELFGRTEQIYRTGDLARWLPDGNLEYLGRMDHQIKLRGFRIELGEIEAVLSQQAVIGEAVVVVHEWEGNQSLAAYVTVAGETIDMSELRATLQSRLPDYMVPNSFTLLDQMPLTPNGKIDRKALPEPDQIPRTGHSIPPRDLIECRLLALWQQILGTNSFGIQDDFFTVGGHSLLAMRLVSLIRQHFDIQLPVAVLFQQKTVAQLAELIRQLQAETDRPVAWSNCVPMQTQGKGTPIYILPGAIGSVLYLQPLTAALGQQQPIYALQTPGLQPGEVTPDTVEALATYHLAAIRQQSPQGPYQILGHSSGGRVAFELACQLEAAGETVALLGVLDTGAPYPQPDWQDPQDDGSETYQIWNLLQIITALTGHTAPDTLAELQTLEIEQAYARVLAWLQQRHLVFTETDTVANLRRWVQTYQATTQGHVRYQTPAQLSCPIHLFRASERTHEPAATDTRQDDRPHWGWDTYTQAQIHEIQVPGTHVTMMVRPQVQTLAEAIQACLKQVSF